MRCSLLALLWFVNLAAPQRAVAQANQTDLPDTGITDVISDLATLSVVDGRLRIDQQRWMEAAYPASEGDQRQQIIEDTKSHRWRPETIREMLQGSPPETLNLYAANKLICRILINSPTRSRTGGVSSNRARLNISTADTSASFRVTIAPYAQIAVQRHKPQVMELLIGDDPKTLFQVVCRHADRLALLTQNNAGRIQLVADGADKPFAMVWPSYAAMLEGGSVPAQRIATDLSSLGVTLPTMTAAAQSTIDVPPSNLQDGPLPRLSRSLSELVQLQLVDGQLSLDRNQWSKVANRALVDEADPNADSPFGGDPFRRRDLLRNAERRRRHRIAADPFDKLIDQFGLAMARSGQSGSSTGSMKIASLNSDSLAANFLSDRENKRIQMSFAELTRHARTLVVDELPGHWFSITYGDPDYTVLLVQNDERVLHWAYCHGLEYGSNVADRYSAVLQRDDQGLKLLSSLLKPLGITFPSQ